MNTKTVVSPPTTAHLDGRHVVSPADRFVDAMVEAFGFDRLVLATRAIRHDPGCIEARIELAEHARDIPTRLRHLEAAVTAGEWLWSAAAEDDADLTWWEDVGTRPYMRALHALGLAYREAGRLHESLACFTRLLVMNPGDQQGIRFLLDTPDEGRTISPRLR